MSVVTEPTALQELAGEWRGLAEARGNPFITPEWFFAWIEHNSDAEAPAVVVARRPDRTLLGLLPFVVTTGGRLRTLRFAGTALADRLEPVCRAEDEDALARAAAAPAGQMGLRWEVASFRNVAAGASWWRTFVAATSARRYRWLRAAVLPQVELGEGGWDAYLATRSRNLRSQARRFSRRLEREHEVVYRLTTRPDELERDIDTLFALHDARWSRKGRSSVTDPRLRAFLRDFSRAALERGWLRLWVMELDGVPAAAWYGWRLGERYLYYQAGFEPRFEAVAPGFVMLCHTIAAAAEEGATVYDMLLGDEPYKGRFATGQRDVQTVTFGRSRRGRAAAAAEAALWRGGRRLPEPLRELAPLISGFLPSRQGA